jgi:hypothetical protein
MTTYFLSYAHGNGTAFGFGNCELDMAYPIESIEDIDTATQLVRDTGVTNPTILHFSRYDTAASETGGKHSYFISYSHGSGNALGFGGDQIIFTNPIRSYHDVRAITQTLRSAGITNPTVLNFTRFDTPGGGAA